jgi:hypothetical protein
MNSYHNTTNEPDPKLFEVKARTQDQIVLEIFRKHPDLTASECHKLYPDFRVPLTSIRRSITNLATDVWMNVPKQQKFRWVHGEQPEEFEVSFLFQTAKLQKTNVKRIGIYGRNEYAYKIINRL